MARKRILKKTDNLESVFFFQDPFSVHIGSSTVPSNLRRVVPAHVVHTRAAYCLASRSRCTSSAEAFSSTSHTDTQSVKFCPTKPNLTTMPCYGKKAVLSGQYTRFRIHGILIAKRGYYGKSGHNKGRDIGSIGIEYTLSRS
jgi:hypothetical protein